MDSKLYNVVGIGNAIVDVLAHVDDAFIDEHGLKKGVTRLIDEAEANYLHGKIDVADQVSGGSAANTIAGLALLDNPVAFIGKVKNDTWGNAFETGMTGCGVHCHANKATDGYSTARCVVLVTPDAQRTMNTFLGISGTLGPENVDEDLISNSYVTYLEGYLWDRPEAKQALLKALRISRVSGGKSAVSLSDSFCVDRHRDEFLDLAKNHVDILFANETEAMALFQTNSIETAISELKSFGIIAAITLGKDGSVIISQDQTHKISAKPAGNLVDTTGAGDLYAAGFLHGLTTGRGLLTAGRMGSIAAAEIISHFGARPKQSLTKLFAENNL